MQMKVENGLQFKQSLSIFNFPLSTEYAGMVELVDSVDLGDVTSGKVFHFTTRTGKMNKRACWNR